MQMGVTDDTAEDKSSMSSSTDLRCDCGSCMGICLTEGMNAGMQLNDHSRDATTQEQEKVLMGWGPGEPAATTCIHVFTEIWKRKDYSGTPHICSERNHVSEAVGSNTSPGFCLLPEQGTQSLSFALCRNWLNSTFFCFSFFKLCSVLRISTLSAIADSRCEPCPFSPFWNLQPHQTKTY